MNEENTQVQNPTPIVETTTTQPIQQTSEQTAQSTSQAATQPAQQTTTQQTQQPQQDISSLREQISKDVTGEVSKSVISKIGEALGLTKKEEEALPTNPTDLKKIVDQRVKEEFERQQKEQQQQLQQTEQQRQEKINSVVSGWYNQYNQLARMNKVPEIKNANDQNDPGVLARRKIIMAIGKMVEENRRQGSDYTPTISDVLLANPNVLRDDVPGADLPISGNTNNTTNNASFSNKEIRNKSFIQIAREGAR